MESDARPRATWWIVLAGLSLVTGVASALAGLFVDRIYAHETAAWTLQGHAQDAVDLLLGFPVVALLLWRTAHGSVRAHLALVGALANILYAYVIYSFDLHFSPAFLLYVATLGLTGWAIAGACAALAGCRLETGAQRPRWPGVVLVLTASVFLVLWLASILPATFSGTTPAALRKVGLPTNPVHVLDLACFLPLTMLAGITWLRGHRLGGLLAPIMLTALPLIAAGIVAILVADAIDGNIASLAPAAVMTALGAVVIAALVRVLQDVPVRTD